MQRIKRKKANRTNTCTDIAIYSILYRFGLCCAVCACYSDLFFFFFFFFRWFHHQIFLLHLNLFGFVQCMWVYLRSFSYTMIIIMKFRIIIIVFSFDFIYNRLKHFSLSLSPRFICTKCKKYKEEYSIYYKSFALAVKSKRTSEQHGERAREK